MRARRRRGERGGALLVVVVLMAALLVLSLGLIRYAGVDSLRAASGARSLQRESCAQSGVQIAKAYFGRNFTRWATFLNEPQRYNPERLPATALDPDPVDPADYSNASFQAANPELFADLDNRPGLDVYIYVRDNDDERPPAGPDYRRDNDQNVIIGAVCISTTMVPADESGSPSRAQLVAETLLQYNTPDGTYRAQAGGGASGTGNLN